MFSYAAVLPLPDVERALAEARFAIEQGGACGIKLSSQAAGLYPGDERMEPLLEYLNERHAVLIFHPTRPQAVPEGCFTSGPLPLLEFINDTTRAVVDLIAKGTLEKYGICGWWFPIAARFCRISWTGWRDHPPAGRKGNRKAGGCAEISAVPVF